MNGYFFTPTWRCNLKHSVKGIIVPNNLPKIKERVNNRAQSWIQAFETLVLTFFLFSGTDFKGQKYKTTSPCTRVSECSDPASHDTGRKKEGMLRRAAFAGRF